MGMNMQQMMRQAQQMQKKMQKDLAQAQDEILEMTCTGKAGGGMVTAVAKGDMTLESLTIAPEAVDPDDVEMLQDLVLAAANEALRGMSEMSSTRLNSVTGGMNIPGLR